MDIIDILSGLKDMGQDKLDEYIKERAITATKAKFAQNHLKIEDFSDEELETIIEEAQREIKDNLKTKFLGSVVAVTLGINFLDF